MKRSLSILVMCLMVAGVALAQEQKQAFERIVALAPHSVEMMFTLGAGHMLVGTSEYGDYPEEAKTIPRVGGYNGLQIEKILSLSPDLIIAWESGNKKQDLQQLKKLGLNLFLSKTERIEDIPKELLEIGALIGRQQEARQAADAFYQRYAQIVEQQKHKAKVPFFYQLWSRPLKTITAGSWINPVLSSCGGINIFPEQGDNHYPQVSIESVLLKHPQAIIIPSHHGAEISSAKDWQVWPEIPAVKQNNIFFIDGDLLHRFSIRILDGMEKVCDAFDLVRRKSNSITEQ